MASQRKQRIAAIAGHKLSAMKGDILTDGFYDAGSVWYGRCERGAGGDDFTAEVYVRAWHRQHRIDVLTNAEVSR